MITGEELTADDIRSYGAELVVVATGSSWAADGFNVYAAPDRRRRPARRDAGARARRAPDGDVAVIDCEGYLVGVGCAELALHRAAGSRTTRRSTGSGRCSTRRSRRACCDPAGRGRAGHGGALPANVAELDAGAVVLVTQRCSDDALYHALTDDPGDVEAVYRVGDCVAPRILADAIFDGHRLASEIDSRIPRCPAVAPRAGRP